MMMLPCAFWPLAEHASFGQNCFDASIGSVHVCICYSMPMDACFFNHSFPFHRIVGFYQSFHVLFTRGKPKWYVCHTSPSRVHVHDVELRPVSFRVSACRVSAIDSKRVAGHEACKRT